MLCYKSEVAVRVIVAIVAEIIFGFIGATKLPQLTNIKEQTVLRRTPVPWLGVLTLDGESFVVNEGLILVTIISDKIGIADAKCMAALNKYKWEEIRNDTHVMFLTKTSQPWYAKVEKFRLHPEFNAETLTTMAILNLEYDLNKFEGNMVRWPSKFNNPTYQDADIFTIGYTNRNGKIEQIVYRMDYIHLNECEIFYFMESLDTKWMRPKYYHCYNVRYNKKTCVFDPAMALVHYAGGTYTLLGLSVWGPGCSLPTRFFDFEPFVPWIMTKMPTRRNYFFKLEAIDYTGETKKQRDRWMLERLYDTKGLALRPIKQGETAEEIVRGKCDGNNMNNDMLVYREIQRYMSRRRFDKKYMKGTAVYALSLYDKNFNGTDYSCIQILAKCKQKSDSELEFSKGFGNEPLDPYVKHGNLHHPSYVLHPYVHTLQNNYEIIEEDTTHLTFRFEFEKEASIEVQFYTNRKVSTTIATTTISLPPTANRTRKRRPYRTTTKYPPKQYWFYKYGYNSKGVSTTELVIHIPTSTTTKMTTSKRPARENTTRYWWNKWWHYKTERYPELDRDWWKG